MTMRLETPVHSLPRVGRSRSETFQKAGIHTLGDLLKKHTPFRYEDRSRFRSIAQLEAGRECLIQGNIEWVKPVVTRVKRFKILELRVSDETGRATVKFFNQPYLERTFRPGHEVVFFGAPRYDDYSGTLVLQNPEFEVLEKESGDPVHTGRIVPIYRRLGRIYSRHLRRIVYHALQGLSDDDVPEVLPPEVVRRFRFPSRLEALRQIHFPEVPEREEPDRFLDRLARRTTPGHQRLIFEEFFRFQLGLLVTRTRRRLISKQRQIVLSDRVRETLKGVLPFHPTAAQKRVLKEIVEDIAGPRVMSRLLQGDVGSGKTIVALQALIVVMENGYQTALMAPTEILAEQHMRSCRRFLEGTPYSLVLLTGSVKGKARKQALEEIRSGQANLVVGTHAVFQAGVEFRDLGMVVIDEQHRFGVLQRSRLIKKGERPDALVMTATPIPRTLALTLYGDLDLSLLDEMPPGRRPVQTILKSSQNREEVYDLVRRQLSLGRQAYIVYPLVEESEKLDLTAAVEASRRLQEEVFTEYKVGLLHGRLKAADKDALMRQFAAGEIHLLAATTVVEVGIDVPNANIMIVEHADRFGLSQLHQLRGRVGRGSDQSYCILMFDGRVSDDARERLEIMRSSNDGFRIAEKDLELRGPGEFLGTRQSGMPTFLFANLVRDQKLLQAARLEAEQYLERLQKEGALNPRNLARLVRRWRTEFGLSQVG